MRGLSTFWDFFLPRFCSSCKIKLTPDERIACNPCLRKIQHTSKERTDSEYARKFLDSDIISGFASLYLFEKDGVLQQIIHDLKYEGKFQIGLFLGGQIGSELKDILDRWELDFIAPVPLHHLKRAERGYNQSYYIAKGIRSRLNIPLQNHLLVRKRFTESQTNLTLIERAENIHNAFISRKKEIIGGKNILLVDDVITTGATVTECGRVLKDNGAANIFAVSAAIAD
ncbi:MAG: ComF family protein [Melioribacteraceae bacterium]